MQAIKCAYRVVCPATPFNQLVALFVGVVVGDGAVGKVSVTIRLKPGTRANTRAFLDVSADFIYHERFPGTFVRNIPDSGPTEPYAYLG